MLPGQAAILSLELQDRSRFFKPETLVFLRTGRFQLCFQGARGKVALRDVSVRVSVSQAQGHQLVVALGLGDLSQLLLGPAWLEKF